MECCFNIGNTDGVEEKAMSGMQGKTCKDCSKICHHYLSNIPIAKDILRKDRTTLHMRIAMDLVAEVLEANTELPQ